MIMLYVYLIVAVCFAAFVKIEGGPYQFYDGCDDWCFAVGAGVLWLPLLLRIIYYLLFKK